MFATRGGVYRVAIGAPTSRAPTRMSWCSRLQLGESTSFSWHDSCIQALRLVWTCGQLPWRGPAVEVAWCMTQLSSLMTSLLEQHEQASGFWGSSSSISGAVLRGRGHACVQPSASAEAEDAVGAWLADASHAESVSWMALRAVQRELKAHDAPASLAEDARALSGASLRNAVALEALALRWGVRRRQPAVVSIAVRPLEALAAENAAEGCVRQTWAALEARYQSLAARDPVIRRTMARVARDGLEHAEFSWAVDAWATPRLDTAARQRVARARAHAAAELLEALATARGRTLCIEAGLPTGVTAQRLVRALSEALWSPASS